MVISLSWFIQLPLGVDMTSSWYCLCSRESISSERNWHFVNLLTCLSPHCARHSSRHWGSVWQKIAHLLECIFWWVYLVSYWCNNKLPFSGLKQHTFIILLFWRLDIQNLFLWSKGSVPARLVPAEALRGKSESLPFSVFGCCLHSLIHTLFLHVQSWQCNFFSLHT